MEENELTNRYFRYIKTCGNFIGAWPFETGWRSTALRYYIYALFVTALFAQGSRMVLVYSFDTIAEQIPYIGVEVLKITKYYNYTVNQQRLAQLIKSLSADWKSIVTEEERMIMQMHVKRATLFACLYKANIYFACFAFGTLPFVPRILDVIKPLNESRPWLLVFPAYYYVDQDKYYYYLLTHTLMCMMSSALTLLFSDCMMIYLVQHACSLLSVAGYRYKHTADKIQCSSAKNPDSPSDIVYKKLRLSIQNHNRAIEIITEIESVYAANLFVQVGTSMIIFSITLLVIALKSFSPDMCPVYGFILVQLIHLLFLTIQGQFVRDSSDAVYTEIYEASWYKAHPRLQRFYALALRRSLTPPVLTAGGLINLDLNSFAEILKASVSYYTVLKSR